MPIRRNLEPRRFREEMDECYLQDYQELLRVHFDEEKFYNNVGFFKLKEHLESVLHSKYKEGVQPTLQVLENLCFVKQQECETVKKEIEDTDLERQKSKVNNFLGSFVLLIERFLEGTTLGDPDKMGMTLSEEKSQGGIADWPMTQVGYEIQNANFKLYGGAQYERLLNEFEYVAHSIEFPKTSIHEVAAALGISKSHNVPLFEAAASDIVQAKAKKTLLPLITLLLQRCSFIMNHLFSITINTILTHESSSCGIGHCDSFIKELRNFYHGFVEKTKSQCETRTLDDFTAFTKILDWDLMSGLSDLTEYLFPSFFFSFPSPFLLFFLKNVVTKTWCTLFLDSFH
eukprot:TRINITY_DN3306_c0_g1_i14.p1 TRINITY_DN3306_c0_g1~~TRINITY_DN3306_c0_g1_i14.p1  ORF type:complete len:344 (+),score=64.79 TRINITY_DN3306_c0_g1_i14:981-2012(+)